MSGQDSNDAVHPSVPPTAPGPLGSRDEKTKWPVVIGVISIVFGSFGAIGGVCGIVAMFFMEQMADLMKVAAGGQDQDEVFRVMGTMGTWLAFASFVAFSLAVLLIIAGAMVLQRRRSAPRLCRLWAVLKIVLVPMAAVIGYLMQTAQFEAMSSDAPTAMAPAMSGLQRGMAACGNIVGLQWGWAWPVFLLIWFRRRKIRSETDAWLS